MTNVTPHFRSVGMDASNEEEVIGDPIYGATLDTLVQGVQRARFMISVDESLPNHAGDSMFVKPAPHRWGWYTTKERNCLADLNEQHDLDGDTVADTLGPEVHCLPVGEFTVRLWHVTWGSLWETQSKSLLRSRRIAMLDSLGSVQVMQGSGKFFDVRVSFDLGGGSAAVSGDIRAGTSWVYPMSADSEVYTSRDSFTVDPGADLWFISTYVASASGRGWSGDRASTLTQFHWDYTNPMLERSGAINSAPLVSMSPIRHTFAGQQRYQVVGRVISPLDDGEDEEDSPIWVTTVGLRACFEWSDTAEVGEELTFDAGCAAGAGLLEYRWTFGDSTAALDWSGSNAVAHHTYASPGQFSVTLQVRVQGSQTVDDTTRTTHISPGPLVGTISGPSLIRLTGTYQWTDSVTGAVPPVSHDWWYDEAQQSVFGATYSRTISVPPGTDYYFVLTDSLADASRRTAADYGVEVVSKGLPLRPEGAGVRFADGTCRLRPTDETAHQAWLLGLYRARLDIVSCTSPGS